MGTVGLTIDVVKAEIAKAMSRQMGIPEDQLLSGVPFNELIEQFDSLAMLEIQLLIEEKFGFEFDANGREGGLIPDNINELAETVLAFYTKVNREGV